MSRIDPVHVHGLKRLRQEYIERNPGGDFKTFLQKWDGLREAMQGDRGPVRFYGLTFGQAERAHLQHGRATASVESDDEVSEGGETEGVTSSIPLDEQGRLDLLKRAGLAEPGAASLSDALRDLELPFMFAGREQWVRNLTSTEARTEPWLQDVSMQSPVDEPNALRLLLGRASEAVEGGRSLAADVAEWRNLVPSWAYGVRDRLAAQGIPFSVELLASPEINLTDPSAPLFPPGTNPRSLFGLGVDQAGENSFLSSMSAEELMLQIWPLSYQYYHRPAGAPVPLGLEAGLTFGSPVLQPDGTYLRSPVMQTDAYRRWSAAGGAG